MPDWGLTDDQRKWSPWGLPVEVLKPGKVVTDPVHGDIHLNWLEVAITDTSSFQRLRRVRQLGTTHLVYPGATHTRFSHSLGAVRVAQTLLDQVLSQGEGLHAVPDLIGQWEKAAEFEKHVAQAVVLARFGGLLHDLCHVPVGHSVEDDLRILQAHDENEARFERLWGNVRASVLASIKRHWSKPEAEGVKMAQTVDETMFVESGSLYKQLRPLIIDQEVEPVCDRWRQGAGAREAKASRVLRRDIVAALVTLHAPETAAQGYGLYREYLDCTAEDASVSGRPLKTVLSLKRPPTGRRPAS